MSEPVTQHLATPQGQIYVAQWLPADPAQADVKAPIILLHDSLGAVVLWRDFPAALCAATGRRVIAYDRLGFGQSDPYPGPMSFDFIAHEPQTSFAAVIQAFRLKQYIIMGHSVGGELAASCAAYDPQGCLAVITESAQAFVEPLTRSGIKAAQQNFAQPEQMERLTRYHGAKAPWVLAAWVDTWLSDTFRDWTIAPVLAQVHCPLLVIHGSADEFGSLDQAAFYTKHTQGPARLIAMPDVGHIPHRTHTEQVLAAITTFLDEHQIS